MELKTGPILGTGSGRPLTASVVIPAFTFDRWKNIVMAVEAVQEQSRLPVELILSIDRNPALLEACQERWGSTDLAVPVKVVANDSGWQPRVATEANSDGVARGYGGGSARNAGAAFATGDVIVTFDDDAWPEPDCIKNLLAPYDDPAVVAVGGKTVPDFETERPRWFPRTFDWIFGCAYEGLPTELAPALRLIGANMSVRTDVFRALGGFRAVDFDDLDMCSRLAHEFGSSALLFEPSAVAHHFVPANRVTWRYFWTRNFLVNRDKVPAFAEMGDAASLAAEIAFVVRTIRSHLVATIRGLFVGDRSEALQLGAALIGIALAGLGNFAGRVHLWRENRRTNKR
jgi:GT2 family glycosyltransferase